MVGSAGGLDPPTPKIDRRVVHGHHTTSEARAGEASPVNSRDVDQSGDERIEHIGAHLEVVAQALVALRHQ